jgi:hypothetical protein
MKGPVVAEGRWFSWELDHSSEGVGPVGQGSDLRMAADRVRGGYLWVSGPAGSGLEMISHPRFSGSVSDLISGSVSGLVFHVWISNGYPK